MAGTLMSPSLPTIEGLRKEEEDPGKNEISCLSFSGSGGRLFNLR